MAIFEAGAMKIKLNYKALNGTYTSFIPFTRADAVVVTDGQTPIYLDDKITDIENKLTPNAEANQNTFSTFSVNNNGTTSSISANSKTSDIEIIAGTNISLVADPTNRKVTINSDGGVLSVNGKTGDVTLSAADVGAATVADLEGEDPYSLAVEGGYTGTESEFYADLVAVNTLETWMANI